MNSAFRKLTATILTGCMIAGMAVSVSAVATGDYAVNITKSGIQITKDGKNVGAVRPYKASDFVLKENSDGNLVFCYTTSAGKESHIVLKGQEDLVVSGTMNSLTVDKSLQFTAPPVIKGTVSVLHVLNDESVYVDKTAKIGNLQVADTSAKVTVAAGAAVTKAGAKSKTSVDGVAASKIGTYTAPKLNVKLTSGTTTSKTPSTTTKPSTSTSTGNGTRKIYLDIEEIDDPTRTTQRDYDESSIDLTAKSGITLGNAIRDLKISVYSSDSDKKISGQWAWVSGSSGTTTSGTYQYRFTPSDGNYQTTTITVEFDSLGSSRGLSKPGISFADSSHGNDGEDVEVNVSLPSNIEDGDEAILYVDGKQQDSKTIYEDDSNEDITMSFLARGDEDDKIKVKVKIERKVGSSSATSDTITYYIDEDR